jgi:lipopolysaccharide/colanic/teichoic acid biosynthesis glycosyltransferase
MDPIDSTGVSLNTRRRKADIGAPHEKEAISRGAGGGIANAPEFNVNRLTFAAPLPNSRWPMTERVLNSGLAILVLAISLPVLIPVALAVLVTSGWPVIHRGTRLGRGKTPYQMLKFRSLTRRANQMIGGRLLSRDDDLVTPIGWFLRDTRLDELPQLLNIIAGHMNFIGPRPVRPELYENLCRNIPGYDNRFSIKPGLIGYSQLFTPHNTPKRIRALIDNRLVSRGPHPVWDLFLIGYTAMTVARATIVRLLLWIGRDLLLQRLFHRYSEKRHLARVRLRQTIAIFDLDEDGPRRFRTPVLDMNDHSVLIECGEPMAQRFPERFELEIVVGRNGRTRRRRVACRGSVAAVRPADRVFGYVVDYQPLSDRSLYLLHQHFLKRSLAGPSA